MTEIFNRTFFLGVGVGMVITILTPLVGDYLFIGWNCGEHLPGAKKILRGSLEASSSPSAFSPDP